MHCNCKCWNEQCLCYVVWWRCSILLLINVKCLRNFSAGTLPKGTTKHNPLVSKNLTWIRTSNLYLFYEWKKPGKAFSLRNKDFGLIRFWRRNYCIILEWECLWIISTVRMWCNYTYGLPTCILMETIMLLLLMPASFSYPEPTVTELSFLLSTRKVKLLNLVIIFEFSIDKTLFKQVLLLLQFQELVNLKRLI